MVHLTIVKLLVTVTSSLNHKFNLKIVKPRKTRKTTNKYIWIAQTTNINITTKKKMICQNDYKIISKKRNLINKLTVYNINF